MKGLQSDTDGVTACKTTWRAPQHRNGEPHPDHICHDLSLPTGSLEDASWNMESVGLALGVIGQLIPGHLPVRLHPAAPLLFEVLSSLKRPTSASSSQACVMTLAKFKTCLRNLPRSQPRYSPVSDDVVQDSFAFAMMACLTASLPSSLSARLQDGGAAAARRFAIVSPGRPAQAEADWWHAQKR